MSESAQKWQEIPWLGRNGKIVDGYFGLIGKNGRCFGLRAGRGPTRPLTADPDTCLSGGEIFFFCLKTFGQF